MAATSLSWSTPKVLPPGQQHVVWKEQYGYWLRGVGIENTTCVGKTLIAVRTLQGVAILRMFSEADQAIEAWADVKAGTVTLESIQTKEYGPRHVPAHTELPAPLCGKPSRRRTAGRRFKAQW